MPVRVLSTREREREREREKEKISIAIRSPGLPCLEIEPASTVARVLRGVGEHLHGKSIEAAGGLEDKRVGGGMRQRRRRIKEIVWSILEVAIRIPHEEHVVLDVRPDRVRAARR